MNAIKNFWRKGKGQKAIIILVVLLLLAGISGALFPAANMNFEFLAGENLTLKLSSHNDTAAVDEIVSIAKKDMESASVEEANEVINHGLYFIKENVNNLTKDNETMEKSIYYGYYIYSYIQNNAGADNLSELSETEKNVYNIGNYTFTTIKYPYRNTEDLNKERVEKIKECINNLQ